MQWSQLRKQLRDRLAPSVATNIDFHQTRYRHAHDQEGEFWMTAGDQRIFSAGSLSYLSALGTLRASYRVEGETAAQACTRAWQVMEGGDRILLEQMHRDLLWSLSQPVDRMLEHGNPVIRALALGDRRFGKRRLVTFDPRNEHHLVQHVHRLRCSVEGIVTPSLP